MGDTLLVLRTFLEDQLGVGTTTASTDPTSTLLNTYINKSQEFIARDLRPRELQEVSDKDIVAGQNYIELPTDMLFPFMVNYCSSAGDWITKIKILSYDQLVSEMGDRFYDSSYTGDPGACAIFGTKLYFSKYFSYSGTSKVKIPYLQKPTTLSSDSDTNEIPADYNLLSAYKSMQLYYIREEDTSNLKKCIELYEKEKSDLKIGLQTNHMEVVQLDSSMFYGEGNYFNKFDYILNSVR